MNLRFIKYKQNYVPKKKITKIIQNPCGEITLSPLQPSRLHHDVLTNEEAYNRIADFINRHNTTVV